MISLPGDTDYNADFQLFDPSFFADAWNDLDASASLNEPSLTTPSTEAPAALDQSLDTTLYPLLIEAKTENADLEFHVLINKTEPSVANPKSKSDFEFSSELQVHSDSDAVWQPSQELMGLISGDNHRFGLSLTNEAYALANQQAAAHVFPNPPELSLVEQIPPDNEDTYRWRGDMGLLDRMVYSSPREVPRNWEMTSLDFRLISARNESFHLTFETQPTGQLEIPSPKHKKRKQTGGDADAEVSEATENPAPKERVSDRLAKRRRGNNQYGRKGTLKCLRCRDRHQPCIFGLPDQPCNYCQDQPHFGPCIKTAPVTFSSSLSDKARAVAARRTSPYKGDLHVLLDDDEALSTLNGRTIGSEFPDGVYDHSLRCAVIAWISRRGRHTKFNFPWSDYVYFAVEELNRCLDRLPTFLNALTSNLLGWLTYSTCSQVGDAHSHFKCSLAITLYLANYASGLLLDLNPSRAYAAFIIDCANAWSVRNGGLPIKNTTFQGRVVYFEHLRGLRDRSNAFFAGVLEAANSTLGNLLEVSLCCTSGIVQHNEFYNEDNIQYILQYLRAELGDPDLHHGLQQIRQSIEGDKRDHSTVEGQLTTRLFHRLTGIMLLVSVLEEPSISAGFATPRAQYLADMLVSGCRFHALRRGGPIEDYYMISWHNFSLLLLGGLALNMEDYPERLWSFLFIADLVDCQWLVDELAFTGKEEYAEKLREYWMNRDEEIMAQILEHAKFPDEMKENL